MEGVFAVGTVRQIRSFETNPAFSAVVVQITEPILNANAGAVITFLTRTSDEACGYPRCASGATYVIESHYYVPAPPSLDAIERLVLDEFWRGVRAGSQIVGLCGKTQPLSTPAGNKALAEIREAVRRLKE